MLHNQCHQTLATHLGLLLKEESEVGGADKNVAPLKQARTELDGSDNFGAYFPKALGKSLIDRIRERTFQKH